ncbi:MAG: acyl-CoA thioesterase [Treponema sp.]|jgi:acyl-CoA thioester hydrolase|nr:acyl-CoA thioesterase [Treponema sp.]
MFTTIVEPRFGDVDGLGHINNTTPAIWFEEARNPVFRLFSPNLEISAESWRLIMAHTDFDFVDELFYPNKVEVRTFVSKIGNKSFTVLHEAWQDGRLCVKGSAVMVYYDFAKKKSEPIPEEIKKSLAEHCFV